MHHRCAIEESGPSSGDARHPFDVIIGKRLRERRHAIDMSQEKLAATLGITFQMVQKYESAACRISASRLVEIARALDVSVYYFFEEVERRFPGK